MVDGEEAEVGVHGGEAFEAFVHDVRGIIDQLSFSHFLLPASSNRRWTGEQERRV